MSKKILTVISFLVILSMALSASVFAPAKATKTVADLAMFKASKFDAHYRVPNEAGIETLLNQEGINLGGSMKAQAVQDFLSKFISRNWDTPDPAKLRDLLKKEQAKAGTMKAQAAARPIKSLVTLVEFNTTPETWTSQVDAAGNCTPTEVTMAGPQHNQIAPPGEFDNNTIWYDDTTPALYEEIYFGEGPDAGVTIHHPNVGDVKMGTMTNYYLELSNGKFAPDGEVYPKWFQADHSEGWYGEDGCDGSHNVRAGQLVQEVLTKLQTTDPTFNWEAYDGNADGVVDNFTVIHAGAGQEAGGGVQGNFAIWSHASLVGWPNGVLVCSAGSAGCPDRDIRVLHYSMDPENIDLGVIAEEFGHAAFGLPDLYSTDAQGSLSNWAIMEAGSWNGKLGGSEPAPFPLFFKYLLGWADVKEIAYNAKPTTTNVGQLENPPKGTYSGIKINLPNKTQEYTNPLETGKAWWSDLGNGVNYTLTRTVDLTGTTAPILSFLSSWSIEDGWDYGYVQVSADGGATWTFLPDMDGVFTTTNPNGNNQGVGLTGEGQGTLRVDLAAYAGQTIQVRLLYSTDTAVQWNGWFTDNFAVTDGTTTLWSDDVENGTTGWTANGWKVVPLTKSFERYYLVEWRSNSGTDHGLQYPYITTYSDVDNWQVDRVPYVVPGMLVYFRDASYAFDYALYDGESDPPSLGPKNGLSIVDSHFWPEEWSNYKYSSGAYLRLNSRAQPYNAAFTSMAMNAQPMTLDLGYDPATGAYGKDGAPYTYETKTFQPPEPIAGFHDSVNYVPGLWYRPATGGLYYWDRAASVVTPAKGIYSTKITDINKQLLPDLFGADIGTGSPLGTGNPGDDGVQYGLHIQVVKPAYDGSSALIQTWNAPGLLDATLKVDKAKVKAGQYLFYTVKVKNTAPVMEAYTATIPLPAGTTLGKITPITGMSYDSATNTIKIEPWPLAPRGVHVFVFALKVNADTPSGTAITTTITLQDEALGDSASATSTVR